MAITKEQAQFLTLDDQGAGRCGIGEAAVGKFLGRENLPKDEILRSKILPNLPATNFYQNVMRAGIRPPDSGREDLHPLVVDLIREKYGIEFLDKKIHLLQEADISANTIVMVLSTDLDSVPAFVFKQAYDVLHAPIIDPFPKLESDLGSADLQIYFYAYLLAHIAETRFEEFGTSRKNGIVVPRPLITLHPQDWEREYFAEMFGDRPPYRFPSSGTLVSMETPSLSPQPMEQAPRSFFEDEWGEPSVMSRPYSFLGRMGRW